MLTKHYSKVVSAGPFLVNLGDILGRTGLKTITFGWDSKVLAALMLVLATVYALAAPTTRVSCFATT